MKKNRILKIGAAYEIPIPHMGYKVMYGVNPKEFSDRQEISMMFAEDTNKNQATIIFRHTPKDIESGAVAHEILHALQFMCRRRNIVMEAETEHMGYLMQYIFKEIYDREYET
jgi:hypothetical protein